MSETVLIALIGAISTVVAAHFTNRGGLRSSSPSPATPSQLNRTRFWQTLSVIAVGVALTSLLVAVVSLQRSNVPNLSIVPFPITPFTPTQKPAGEPNLLLAPKVSKGSQIYSLPGAVPDGCKPIAIWHGINSSHPTSNFIYALSPKIEDGKVSVELSSRDEAEAEGYARVNIYVLCDMRYAKTRDGKKK